MAARRVVRAFARVSPVLEVLVEGRAVVTTGEHPFWVAGTGWTPAGQLAAGDVLVSHDGQELPVTAVRDAGRVESVYNVEVEHDHTYFVGEVVWGFSVWAHNKCHGNSLTSTKLTTLYQLVDKKSGEMLKWGISSNPAKRYSAKLLATHNAKLVPILQGTRARMAQIERSATSQFPGLLNREKWAGSMFRR